MWIAGLVATGLLIAIVIVGFGSYCLAELINEGDHPSEPKHRP
jgi:hypothetical protein